MMINQAYVEGCKCRSCRDRKEMGMTTPYNADAVDLSQFLKRIGQPLGQIPLGQQQTFAAQQQALQEQMGQLGGYLLGVDSAVGTDATCVAQIVAGKITSIEWVNNINGRASGDEGVGLVPMSKDPLGRLAKPARTVPTMPANALAWTGCGAAPMIEWND